MAGYGEGNNYPCQDVDSLPPAVFNEACVLTNVAYNDTAYTLAQRALNTCCGPDDVTRLGSCYTYCNITTPYDTVMIDICLEDNLDADTAESLNFDCFPFAWELSSTADTSAGRIATTWTKPDQTVTVTESDGSVVTETFDYSGNILPTTTSVGAAGSSRTTSISAPSVTATSPVATRPTSTAPAPTASPKTSRAALETRFSYGLRLLVILSVYALAI